MSRLENDLEKDVFRRAIIGVLDVSKKSFLNAVGIECLSMGNIYFSPVWNESCEPNPIITLSENVNIEFVKVDAAGERFMMPTSLARDDVSYHEVFFEKNFFIGRYEVTQAQWNAVFGNNPSLNKQNDQLPVEQVSYEDALLFCRKLKEMVKIPEGWDITLPTEAQWEYAACGGKKREGRSHIYSGSNNLDEVGWYYENSGHNKLNEKEWNEKICSDNHNQTHPVGQKAPNELGLYDMSGNVWEWCLDAYQSDISKHNNGDNPVSQGNERVLRGGDLCDYAWRCAILVRRKDTPTKRYERFGFRLALVQESSK